MMIALAMPAVLGFGAVAVDLGSIYLTTRHLQGVADLAALAAANDLDHAAAAAGATAAANPMDAPISTAVITGVYTPAGSVAPVQRFVAGGSSPTAAQVTLHSKASLFFGAGLIGRQSFDISRTATAARAQLASFSIGSRLAAVNGGIENALLSALTGSSVSLSVMDYNALASANVDLFDYVSALRSRLSLQGATYSQVLSTQASTGTAMQALADVLAASGSNQAATAARTLAIAQPSSSKADLSSLIDPGPYGAQDRVSGGSGASVSLAALDLADALLQVANGGRQVQLNLAASVPGLASTTAWLAIGQRASNSPWIAITDAGSVIVSTAQARLYIDTQVAVPGLAVLGVASLHIPAYVELAKAQAKLSSLSCAAGSVGLAVMPSVGRVAIAQANTANLDDFTTPQTLSPATLINVVLLKATAYGAVDLGGGVWQPVTFSASDIAAHVVKSVDTQNIAQASVASLVGATQLNVQLFGLGLGVGQSSTTAVLSQTLSSAAAPIDSTIDGLEALLGLHLGEADVRINGLRCNGAALVA